MKKLGGGWQHVVYDMDNGRVYKKFRSPLNRFFHIGFHSEMSFLDISKESKRMVLEVTRSFEILKQNKIPRELIGNPELLPNFDYIQDKVIPLQIVLNEYDTERAKEVVDEFIALNKKMLNDGFIDLSFKIAVNFGLNSRGQIILTDIGEIVTDPLRIIKQRKERDWHSDYVCDQIKNTEVRKYYQGQMDLHFGL